eukprot:scaffold131558_cov57-Phaeocystis_antarctica.AAC.2
MACAWRVGASDGRIRHGPIPPIMVGSQALPGAPKIPNNHTQHWPLRNGMGNRIGATPYPLSIMQIFV